MNEQQQCSTVSEIKSQVVELYKISKLLQEQLSLINSMIDKLMSRHHEISVQDESVISVSSASNFLTLSKTNENSKITPVQATYSDILNQNLTQENPVLEEDNEKSVQIVDKISGKGSRKNNDKDKSVKQKHSNQSSVQRSSRKQNIKSIKQTKTKEHHQGRTLLIGDSVMSSINRKGLTKGVECKSVPGATVDIIKDSLQIFDITKLDNFIVYVGGNSALNGTDLEYFEEKYEQLIEYVKDKSCSCKLLLCTVCPQGDTDVTDINDVIIRLCHTHELTYIDANADFCDKKNSLRGHFYRPRATIHLSRSWIKRLLGSIEQHVYIVQNFENCVYPINQSENNQRSSSEPKGARFLPTQSQEFRGTEAIHFRNGYQLNLQGSHGEMVQAPRNSEKSPIRTYTRKQTGKTYEMWLDKPHDRFL